MLPDEPTTDQNEDTQPRPVVEAVGEGVPPAPKLRRRWPWYILIYILVLASVSALAFVQGRSQNTRAEQEQVSQFLTEQFELGMADLEAGKYELARQRFEAILRYDPTFPQVESLLIEVYVHLDVPTPFPTPMPTATPDPSPPDQLLVQAQTAYDNGDWTTAISKLLVLRAKDPTYEAVTADGIMYLALRNRGMELIAQGFMEEGLYDLSLAERFGPLDRDAFFRRTLAEQYMQANSYFGLNWLTASNLFFELCQQGATVDSCPKYAEASWRYGEQLLAAEDPCAAQLYYEASLAAWQNDLIEPTATQVARECARATAPPVLPPTATETPTPDGGGTPAPTPTATPTQESGP
jgi:tetratricopeptide (TPR) repeat protein